MLKKAVTLLFALGVVWVVLPIVWKVPALKEPLPEAHDVWRADVLPLNMMLSVFSSLTFLFIIALNLPLRRWLWQTEKARAVCHSAGSIPRGPDLEAGSCTGDRAKSRQPCVLADEDDDGFLSCEEDLEEGIVDDAADRPAPTSGLVAWSAEDWAAEGLSAEPGLVEELRKVCRPEALESELRRFLVANGGNVARASEHYLRAREEAKKVAGYLAGPGRVAVAEARRAGACFLFPQDAVDRRGHPVICFNGAAHDPKLFKPEVISALAVQVATEADAVVRRLQREQRVAKVLLIFYIPRGSPMDLSAYSAMISSITTIFPEGLYRCLVCPAGGKVPWLYRLVRPFLPATLQGLVTFVAPGKWRKPEFRAEMSTYFNLSLLPETFGGDLAWWPPGAKGRKDRWQVACGQALPVST